MQKSELKIKNLVEITSIVTESTDFFDIKDTVIDKMLEVVPQKACVNLFYDDDYENAYLVCSKSLEYIPRLFRTNNIRGTKIPFDNYSDFIHQAVENKEIIYVENVFEDERAQKDVAMAMEEGYKGRIVFPLSVENKVVGFMTIFVCEKEGVSVEDINFISSVASLLSLSIEITNKNRNMNNLIEKFRNSIDYINYDTRQLYKNRKIGEFLVNICKQVCFITRSKEAVVYLSGENNTYKTINFYNTDEHRSNIFPLVKDIMKEKKIGGYKNLFFDEKYPKINSLMYLKLVQDDKELGCMICANSSGYTEDDFKIFRILAGQVTVEILLYDYNIRETKHKVLEQELNILNKQQELIMDDSNIEFNNKKELFFYHKPAKVVGGDFYYAEKLESNKTAFIVCDVMGHGIVSNYSVALVKGAFKVLCRDNSKAKDILTKLNDVLYDEFDKLGIFATCLVGIYDSENDNLSIANAGHYSPLFINSKNNEDLEFKVEKQIPIGVLKDVVYEEIQVNTKAYELICMFTDGIIEIKNENKEEFSIERLKKFLIENLSLPKNILIEKMLKTTMFFQKNNNYSDDILVVFLKNK